MDCLQVLMLWEPVRAAAGLENDTDTLRAWCHVSLQPVLQSYAAAQTHYANLNISVSALLPPAEENREPIVLSCMTA